MLILLPLDSHAMAENVRKQAKDMNRLHPRDTAIQFSRLVMSDSLRLHEPQHARPPCPSPSPRVVLESTQTHVHQVGDAIQPSHPLSSPSPPAFSFAQHWGLFQ